MLIDKLKRIGFNDSEARAYQALLSKGWMLPSQLAKELNLSQTAAKNILDFLIREELVKIIKIKKKSYYLVEETEKLKDFCQRREDEILKNIHKRKKMMNEVVSEVKLLNADFSGPTAFFIEGVENIKDIHEMVLECKSREVFEVVPLDNLRFKHKKGGHRDKMKKSGIKFLALYSSKNKNILPNEKNIKRYFLPKRKTGEDISSEIILFDDKLVLFSQDQLKNMVITDKRIVETIKCLFLAALGSSGVIEGGEN